MFATGCVHAWSSAVTNVKRLRFEAPSSHAGGCFSNWEGGGPRISLENPQGGSGFGTTPPVFTTRTDALAQALLPREPLPESFQAVGAGRLAA